MEKENKQSEQKINKPQQGQEINLILRSYAKRKGDRYYACCIDLNLAVERDTIEAALKELHVEIELYFESIQKMGFPKHLLYRRAGFGDKLTFYGIHALCIIRSLLNRSVECNRSLDIQQKHLDCPA